MFGLFRRKHKSKKFICYTITDAENHIYYVSHDLQLASEIYKDIVVAENYEHYISWCNLRNLDAFANESIDEYLDATDVTSDYFIKEIVIEPKDVVSYIRMALHLKPLLIDEEPDYEKVNYFESLPLEGQLALMTVLQKNDKLYAREIELLNQIIKENNITHEN